VASGAWATNGSLAQCADDEIVVGGGFLCESSTVGSDRKGYAHLNEPLGNGWVIDCYGADGLGDVYGVAYAICMKK
jgi:hypothetical protein